MKIVSQNGVVISRGYRLELKKEVNTKNHTEYAFKLVFYEKGVGTEIDSITKSKINNYQDAWRFIESNIGSSTNCDFTEEAVRMIFDK